MNEEDDANHRCPNDHPLKLFITDLPNYNCDVCQLLLPQSSTMFACRACNFDKCENCCSRKVPEEEKKKAAEADKVANEAREKAKAEEAAKKLEEAKAKEEAAKKEDDTKAKEEAARKEEDTKANEEEAAKKKTEDNRREAAVTIQRFVRRRLAIQAIYHFLASWSRLRPPPMPPPPFPPPPLNQSHEEHHEVEEKRSCEEEDEKGQLPTLEEKDNESQETPPQFQTEIREDDTPRKVQTANDALLDPPNLTVIQDDDLQRNHEEIQKEISLESQSTMRGDDLLEDGQDALQVKVDKECSTNHVQLSSSPTPLNPSDGIVTELAVATSLPKQLVPSDDKDNAQLSSTQEPLNPSDVIVAELVVTTNLPKQLVSSDKMDTAQLSNSPGPLNPTDVTVTESVATSWPTRLHPSITSLPKPLVPSDGMTNELTDVMDPEFSVVSSLPKPLVPSDDMINESAVFPSLPRPLNDGIVLNIEDHLNASSSTIYRAPNSGDLDDNDDDASFATNLLIPCIQWKPARFEHYDQRWHIVLEWESSSYAESYILFARQGSGAWYRHATISAQEKENEAGEKSTRTASCKVLWKAGESEAGYRFVVQSIGNFDDPTMLSEVLGPVVAPAAPGPVRQLAVAEVAPCTLEVSWKHPASPPENCGGHTSQELDYEVLIENELQQQSLTVSKNCEVTIRDVDPNHCYTIQVCAVDELERRGPYCIAPRHVDVRRVYIPMLPLDFCAARSWREKHKAPIPMEWRCWYGIDIIVCFVAVLAPLACDMELAVSLYVEIGDPLIMSQFFGVYYLFGAMATVIAEMMEEICHPLITLFLAKLLFCLAVLTFQLYVSLHNNDDLERAEYFWQAERNAFRGILKMRDAFPDTFLFNQEAFFLVVLRAICGATSSAIRQLTLHFVLPSEILSKGEHRCLGFVVAFLFSKCSPLGFGVLAIILSTGLDISHATYSMTRGLTIVVLVSAIGGLLFGPHASRPEAALSLFRVSTPAVLRRYICLCEAELRKAIDSLLSDEKWSFAAEVRACLLNWEGANKPLWMWSLRSLSLLDDQAPLLGLSDASILTAMAALLRKQLLGAEDDLMESFEIARNTILGKAHLLSKLTEKPQPLSKQEQRVMLDVLCIGAVLAEPVEGHSKERQSGSNPNAKSKTPRSLSYSVAHLHDALSDVHTISQLAIPCPDIATTYVVSRTSRQTWLSCLGCCHCCNASVLEQRVAIDRAIHMLQHKDSHANKSDEDTTRKSITHDMQTGHACPKWARILDLVKREVMLRAFDRYEFDKDIKDKLEDIMQAILSVSDSQELFAVPQKITKQKSGSKETELNQSEFCEKYGKRYGTSFDTPEESDKIEASMAYEPTIQKFAEKIMAPLVTGGKDDKWKASVGYALICLMRRVDSSLVNDNLDTSLDDIASRLLREHTQKKVKWSTVPSAQKASAKKFIKKFLRIRIFGLRQWTARATFDAYTLASVWHLATRDGNQTQLTPEDEHTCFDLVRSLHEKGPWLNSKDTLKVTFEPGLHSEWQFQVEGDDDGKVIHVGHHGHKEGVRVGMKILKVDGYEYSKDLLLKYNHEEHPYEVTFINPLLSICQGVEEQLFEVFNGLLGDDGSAEVVTNRLIALTNWIVSYRNELHRRLGAPGQPMIEREKTQDQRKANDGVEALAAALALGFDEIEELNIVAEGCTILALHFGMRGHHGELTTSASEGICLGAILNLLHAVGTSLVRSLHATSTSSSSPELHIDLPGCLLHALHIGVSGDYFWQPFVELVETGDACKFLAAVAAGGGIEAAVAWAPTVRRTSEDAETTQTLLLFFLHMVRSGSVPPPLPPAPPELPHCEKYDGTSDYIAWVLRYMGRRGDGLLHMQDAFVMINEHTGEHCGLTKYNEFCIERGTSPSVGLTLEDARDLLERSKSSHSESDHDHDLARRLYYEFELGPGGYGRNNIQHSEQRRHEHQINVQRSALVAWGISDTLGLWLTHFFGPQTTHVDSSKLMPNTHAHDCCSSFLCCCARAKTTEGLKNVRTSELRGILALQNRPHELARSWRASAAASQGTTVAPWRGVRGGGVSRALNSNRAGNKRAQQVVPYTDPADHHAGAISSVRFDGKPKVRHFHNSNDFCHSPTVMWKGGLRRDELRHLEKVKVFRRSWLVETFALHRWGCTSHVWPAMVSTCIHAAAEAGFLSLLPQFFRKHHQSFQLSLGGACGCAAGVLASLVLGQTLGALHLEQRLRHWRECTLPVDQKTMQAGKEAWESDCLALSICVNMALVCYTVAWLPGIAFHSVMPLLAIAALLLGVSRPLLELPLRLQPRLGHDDGRIKLLNLNRAFVLRSIIVAFFFPYLVWFSDSQDEARSKYWDTLQTIAPWLFVEWQKWIQVAEEEYGHLAAYFASLSMYLLVLALLPLVSWHSSALRKRAFNHPVNRALHFKPPQRSMARGGPPVDGTPIVIRVEARQLIIQWNRLHSTRDMVFDAEVSLDFGQWGSATKFGIRWPEDPRLPRCYVPVHLIPQGSAIRLRVRTAPASSYSLKRKLQVDDKMLLWGPWSKHSLLFHRPSDLRVPVVIRPFVSLLCLPMFFLDGFFVTIPKAWMEKVFHPSNWMKVFRYIVLFALWPFVIINMLFWMLPQAVYRFAYNICCKHRCSWLLLLPVFIVCSPFILVYGVLKSIHKFLHEWNRSVNVEAYPVVEDIGPVLDLKALPVTLRIYGVTGHNAFVNGMYDLQASDYNEKPLWRKRDDDDDKWLLWFANGDGSGWLVTDTKHKDQPHNQCLAGWLWSDDEGSAALPMEVHEWKVNDSCLPQAITKADNWQSHSVRVMEARWYEVSDKPITQQPSICLGMSGNDLQSRHIWPKMSKSSRLLVLDDERMGERTKLKLTIHRKEKDPVHVNCHLSTAALRRQHDTENPLDIGSRATAEQTATGRSEPWYYDSSALEKCIGASFERLPVTCVSGIMNTTVFTNSETLAPRRWRRKRLHENKVLFVSAAIVSHLLDVRSFVEKLISQGALGLVFETDVSPDWNDSEPPDIPIFVIARETAEEHHYDMEPYSGSSIMGIGLCVEDMFFEELEARWKPTGLYDSREHEDCSIIVLQHRSISFSKNEEFGEDSWTTCAIVDQASGAVRCSAPRTSEGVQFRLLGDAQNAWQPLTKFIELEAVRATPESAQEMADRSLHIEAPTFAQDACKPHKKETKVRDIDSTSPQIQVRGDKRITDARRLHPKKDRASTPHPKVNTSEEDMSVPLVQPKSESLQSKITSGRQTQASEKALQPALSQPALSSACPSESAILEQYESGAYESGAVVPCESMPHEICKVPHADPLYEACAQAQWGSLNKKKASRLNNIDWLG